MRLARRKSRNIARRILSYLQRKLVGCYRTPATELCFQLQLVAQSWSGQLPDFNSEWLADSNFPRKLGQLQLRLLPVPGPTLQLP